jgi:hypothetical protein
MNDRFLLDILKQAGGHIINMVNFEKSVNQRSLTTDFLLYPINFCRMQLRVFL